MKDSNAAAERFIRRFGWAPCEGAPGGRVYEDLEGPEPDSFIEGAPEPRNGLGWVWLTLEAEAKAAEVRAARAKRVRGRAYRREEAAWYAAHKEREDARMAEQEARARRHSFIGEDVY